MADLPAEDPAHVQTHEGIYEWALSRFDVNLAETVRARCSETFLESSDCRARLLLAKLHCLTELQDAGKAAYDDAVGWLDSLREILQLAPDVEGFAEIHMAVRTQVRTGEGWSAARPRRLARARAASAPWRPRASGGRARALPFTLASHHSTLPCLPPTTLPTLPFPRHAIAP